MNNFNGYIMKIKNEADLAKMMIKRKERMLVKNVPDAALDKNGKDQ